MAILKPETNQPIEIALKFPKGKPKRGFDGPQVEYVLVSGDLIYLPESTADDIAALNLSPREPFILTKQAKGACHTGPHGIGQKSADSTCIPLCRIHHSDSEVGLDRIGRAAFEDLHGVNVGKLVLLTQRRAAACGIGATPVIERKPVARVRVLGSRLARRG